MKITEKALEFAKQILSQDHSGHDFYHTLRVRDLALRIADVESASLPPGANLDLEIIELAAILHDLDDPKLTGDFSGKLPNARKLMTSENFPSNRMESVCAIITMVSFKGSGSRIPESIEGKIVQDADRLDALGAVGIARAFAYGGSKNRPLYDPELPPRLKMSAEEYYRNQGSTINHFYEKLLLLKDLMNTDSARKIAESRHAFMKAFLAEFYAEWGESAGVETDTFR